MNDLAPVKTAFSIFRIGYTKTARFAKVLFLALMRNGYITAGQPGLILTH
jgi:hypothetical protein